VASRSSALWLALLCAVACGPAESPSGPELPAAVVLHVHAVEVGPRDASSDWDGAEPGSDAGAGCRVLMGGVAIVEPALSPASALCSLATGPHRERQAQNPDLQVRLAVGTDVGYTSWVAPDTTSQSLQYSFVVPVAAIPADGLRFEVLDDDGQQGPELIGSMRVFRKQLTAAYRSPSKLVTLSGGAVRRLEVVVAPYTDESAASVPMQAKDRPTPVGRKAMAGEFFSVRASGTFTVGSWFDKTLDPAGYPGGDARSYNLRSFVNEPHACAIALVGDGATVEGVAVRSGTDFVAGHSGALRVGLNDKDLSNNSGRVSFVVARRAPTAAEWVTRGRTK
jgi:hypothetical protein